MLLGQTLKHEGWCVEVIPEKVKTDKTDLNGYSGNGLKGCAQCNNNFNPACGVNNVTYKNLCVIRECARIKDSHVGSCGIPEKSVAKIDSKTVTQSICKADVFVPVCGGNNVTYQSDCVRKSAKTFKLKDGSCLNKCGCTDI